MPLARALVGLFDVVHEGIYIGTLNAGRDSTVAANPHLKLMLGHPPEAEGLGGATVRTGAVRRPAGTERVP